jgi:hypothetical protein
MASLTLSDGTRSYDFLAEPRPSIYVQQEGINLPVVTDENTYAEGSDSEGRSRIRSRATNSEAGSFSVFFKATTAALFWDAVDNLQELVLSAHRNKGTLTYTPPNGVAVTYDLEAINLTDLPQRGVQLRQFHGEATVSFEVKPYGRLAATSLQPDYSYGTRVNSTAAMLLSLGATSGLTDLSGNGNHGTAAGGVTVGGATGPLTIDDDGATNFDGTNDRITTAAASVFANTSTRTFMGWANRDTTSGYHTLFGGSGSSSTSPLLWIVTGASQTVTFRPDASGSGTDWVAAWYPGIAHWVHWALVFNETSNAVSLYINGELFSTQTNTTPYSASAGNLEIGSWGGGSEYFDGKQAWFSVHALGLTATQIRDAYKAGLAQRALDGPIDSFYVSGVDGQVDAWGDLTLTDSSTIARNQIEVGVQHDFDPNNAEPLIRNLASGLTALGGSSNTRAASYSTNIIRAALTTSPVAVCKAASQPHKGKWKVRARVYPSATTVRVRLAWRAGDGPFAKEKWVAVPNSAGWYDLDLGTVNIKELPSGHTSEFRVEAKTTSGVPTVDVDIMELIPSDSYTKLRGSTSPEVGTGAAIAVDDFSTQTAGALNGKTPLLVPSGNWVRSGDADDFTVDATNHQIYRSAVSDATLDTGCFERCGTGVLAATIASVDFYRLPDYWDTAAGGARFGVFLRYVDTSNYVLACYESANTLIRVIKRVAGTITTLGTAIVPGLGVGWRTLSIGADTSGNTLTYEGPQGGTLVPIILSLADSSLATAGALDDGGYGIYDGTTGTDALAIRNYDNFSVSTLATSASIINPAINSGYGTELTHETALTASSTATGTTPIREGKYLTLPPSTRNGTVSRIVVRARRDDNDLGLADSGITDTLTASLDVTPRVHLTGE